jgi:excinuclease ABC subunit C
VATVSDQQAAIRDRLSEVPAEPGVYLFKDASAQFLYVGKAANLRNRLRSYFGKSWNLAPKIRRMVERAADFEFMVTSSESEALILENTLIKRHRPPYNTRLRDDKTYPYIKIDLKEDFPLVSFTRRVLEDGAHYFGPFASAGSVRRTLDLLKKLFPYRSCTKVITGTDARPCLEYYIHRCVAPCVGYASQEEYRQVVQQVLLFLQGHTEAVVRQLKAQMQQVADALEFERAARLRDQLRAIERVSEEQRVVSTRREDMDVAAMVQEKDEAWVEVFFIRQGRLIGRDHFTMEGTRDEPPGRVLASFVKQFYDRASYIPPQVLLQHPVEDAPLIQEWLQAKRGSRVALLAPARGEKRKLVAMVAENASQDLLQSRARRLADQDALATAMQELQEALTLPRAPRRIECYDISNIRGTDAVGSMAVFVEGKPRPAHYRRFKIRTVGEIDDYAMMREVLRRRFGRLAQQGAEALQRRALGGEALALSPPQADRRGQREGEAGEAWGIIPDLVLIDGGKGHLSAAHQVFLELGISTEAIPLAALAKEREELFTPQVAEPILLPRGSQGLFLVQRVRDEAHRFAITYHQKLRSKRAVQSELDGVPGIGPKRKRMLLRQFGTLRGVREAPLEELAAVPGMTRALAQRIKERL